MQEWGFYLEGVWLVMPSEEASRQKCDKLLYVSMGGACVLHPPSELLHLNQAGVQHLISNLTNTHASTL